MATEGPIENILSFVWVAQTLNVLGLFSMADKIGSQNHRRYFNQTLANERANEERDLKVKQETGGSSEATSSQLWLVKVHNFSW